MNAVLDDTYRSLIDGLCALDDAMNGHPQVSEANRPQALACLERILVDLPALDEHIRRLQKQFGRTFRHQVLLPEELSKQIVSKGAGVLSNDELAVLFLNPIALRDLAFQIHEAPSNCWLERMSVVGRQVMQAEGIARKPRKVLVPASEEKAKPSLRNGPEFLSGETEGDRMATAQTAAAGEHFVAYRLSSLGLLAALTRGGSPTVDVLVGGPSGQAAMSLQVKTSNWAWRSYKRKPEKNHWEWFVGTKAKDLRGESIYYAFVDLKGGGLAVPDVFVIPSEVVADAFAGTNYAANVFWLMAGNKDKYLEAWGPILQRLAPSQRPHINEVAAAVPEQDEPTDEAPVAELDH
jgi:hypothetical protein